MNRPGLTRTLAALALAAAAGCASDPNYGALDAGATPDGNSPDVDNTPDVHNSPVPPPAPVLAAGVRWVGRVDVTSSPDHPRFSWSGSGFVAKFTGTSLAADLMITGTAQIFKAVVDDAPQAPFTATAGQVTHMLA